MPTPEFLEIADILDIHQILIGKFDGMSGIRAYLRTVQKGSKATIF